MIDPGVFNLLINSGIAGLFAAFTLMLFDRFNRYLERHDKMFVGFLEAERQQRMSIMNEAQQTLREMVEHARESRRD